MLLSSDSIQVLMWANKQLQVPWLLVCSPVAAHSLPGHIHCSGGQWLRLGYVCIGVQIEGIVSGELRCTGQ